jgi:hypothetical protein
VGPATLYEHARSSTSVSDRFFPLYSYAKDSRTGEMSAWALLYYAEDIPARTTRVLFPLASYAEDKAAGETRVGVLGWAPASLYEHSRSPSSASDRLTPLYSYARDGRKGETNLWVLGAGGVSLYQHSRSSTGVSDRLFPFYSYGRDARTGERRLWALFYRSTDGPARAARGLFPFFSWEKDKARGELRAGALGWGPVSLYQHVRTKDGVDDRFVGLYHYQTDSVKKEGEASFLWPLVDYKTANGGSEFSVLWWLVDRTRSSGGDTEFRVLGGSAMALFRRTASAHATKVEFNPIIPFYSHETREGQLVDWGVLGFGRCTKDGRPATKALWMCF